MSQSNEQYNRAIDDAAEYVKLQIEKGRREVDGLNFIKRTYYSREIQMFESILNQISDIRLEILRMKK